MDVLWELEFRKKEVTMLNFKTWGSGPITAVLLHGLSSDSGTWQTVGIELAGLGYRVIAPDLIGHGKSERLPAYSLSAFLESLLDTIPFKPDLVIGHSLGGLIAALALDALAPRKIIYVEPAWGASNESVEKFFRPLAGLSLGQVEKMMPTASADIQRSRFQALSDWDVNTTEITIGFAGLTPAKPDIPSLIVLADPSMVISGDKEGELKALGFTIVNIQGTGHVVYQDNPVKFMETVEGWL
jgi:pimeloyl-ACP methyl ester carboxylesterase